MTIFAWESETQLYDNLESEGAKKFKHGENSFKFCAVLTIEICFLYIFIVGNLQNIFMKHVDLNLIS